MEIIIYFGTDFNAPRKENLSINENQPNFKEKYNIGPQEKMANGTENEVLKFYDAK